MIVFNDTVRQSTAPMTPTSAVANQGVRNFGATDDIHELSGPGHARSRPEEYSTRPDWITIAGWTIEIVMRSETIWLTVLSDVASRNAFSGADPVVAWSSLGAPSRTAVVGTSSAITVIRSDQRIARAIPRLEPRVSSARF